MSTLKDYSQDDQLFYIEEFIKYCNEVCTKVEEPKSPKPNINAEALMMNQINIKQN